VASAFDQDLPIARARALPRFRVPLVQLMGLRAFTVERLDDLLVSSPGRWFLVSHLKPSGDDFINP